MMRLSRIYFLSAIALGSLSLASCADDDKVQEEGVKVLSAETSFDAAGGDGQITVSKAVSKVYAQDSWLSVEPKGSAVNISAGANVSNESRHTTVVVKASETDSTIINVSQLGSVFVLEGMDDVIVSSSDAAVSYAYYVKHDLPVEVSASDDWIKTSVTTDSLTVGLSENTTGHLRRGWVAYSCGSIKDTVDVVQYVFDEHIAGNYYLVYTNTKGAQKALSAQLAIDSVGNYTLALPQLGFTIPVAFDEKTCQLSIAGGSYIGDYQADEQTVYHVGVVLADSESGETQLSSSATTAASFQFDGENGTYAVFGKGTFSADCLLLGAFSSTDFSDDTYLGNLMVMYYPYLLQVEADARKR